MSDLALSLLGPMRISLDGKPFNGLRIRPAVALLVYLACQPERHRREQIMEMLWPEWSQSSAQQNLRQTIYTLRQALPEAAARDGHGAVPLILTDRESVQLNPDSSVAVDIHHFLTLLKQSTPEALATAVESYRGDFLADFYLPGSSAFEEWAGARRAAYRRLVLEALERLADNALETNDLSAAERYARRQLEIDSLRESAHRQLMLILARSGQRAASLTHFEAYRRLVNEELGIEPADDIRSLAERIARNTEVPTVSKATASGAKAVRHNLPAQMTSFLGRERDVSEVLELLTSPSVRLLTLTGVGGTGKTRLALEVASSVAGEFADGVTFVPLETVRDPALILTELIRALGVKERVGASSADAVKAHLRERHLLLVLDNFEQVVEGAALVSDVLRAAPDVKALVTSREELRIYGEHVYAVPSMDLPPEGASRASALEGIDSVRLFVQRARSVRHEFRLTDNNAADIAAICRGLDGLPLAIELAAARLKRMTPAQLRDGLGLRLSLLTSDLRDVNSRQRTLRDMIDWSYNLLTVEDRILFARLSVFAGGCTLEAAEEIAAGEPVTDVLIGLDSLLAKNLIRMWDTGNGERRYGMLETIREYALEKLRESGEDDRCAGKHLSYFFELRKVGSLQSNLTHNRDLWAVEQANYLAAIEWGSRQPDISMAVRLAITTSFVWETYGWYHEALNFALRFRSLPGIIDPPWIASAIRTQAAGKAIFLREYELARELLFEALEIDRAGNRPLDEVHTLNMLGRVDIEEGKYADGLEFCDQARRVAREHGIAVTDFLTAWTAEALLGLGRLDSATEILAPAAELSQYFDDSGLVWPRLAELELMRGRYNKACETLRHGHYPVRPRIRIWRNFLVGVAGWLLERPESDLEDVTTATRLLAINEALAERTGDVLSAFYEGLVEHRVELARERLTPQDFQTAWHIGIGWSEEEADSVMVSVLKSQD